MSFKEIDGQGYIHYYNDKRQLHRENGPALEMGKYKAWYLNGKRHREDGPAIEYPDGAKVWFLHDNRYSYREYKIKMRSIKLKQIL